MEEVKKKRGRKPKQTASQEEVMETAQETPQRLTVGQPEQPDPLKVAIDYIGSILSTVFKF
jgi:hypothetical protein